MREFLAKVGLYAIFVAIIFLIKLYHDLHQS
jgi:hypothetical protein